MPSLNEILSIGKGGMNVSKALLSIAGKNMANVNTPGYNREVLGLKSSPYASLGVQTSGPDRISNPFLSDSVRSIAGDLGFYQGQLIPLEALEPTVNDLDGTGLGQALTSFNGALQDATANPSSSVQRMALIEATEYLAQSFHTSSKLMVDSAEKTRDQAESTADRITALAGDVAELNSEIMVLQSNTTPPNALMNTRDSLLSELSELISIDTLDTGDGSISVFIAGGRPLVDHAQASTVKITPSDPPPGTVAAIEIRKPNGQELKAMGKTGGSLGGLLEAHNEVIVDAMTSLDELAFTLMNSFNAQHQAGFDMNGAPGGDFFEPLAVQSGAASLISVSANIRDNPEHIAASSTLGGVPGNNENLKILEDI
jgi:flagellar hook-associated protein 1 FlgK